MTPHERFEWHDHKAADNLRKHGVSFDDAAAVLADPAAEWFHVEQFDELHSTEAEDRYITTGSHPAARDLVLRVVWTPVGQHQNPATRIISARPVTKRERKRYEQEINQR